MHSFHNHTHRIAFLSALALVLLCIYWEWLGAPIRPGSATLALKALPLLLCLPGIWKAKLYTLQITSMLVLLYMAEGIIRALGDTGYSQVLAAIEFILSWVCFFACILYVRPFKKAHKNKTNTPLSPS